MELRSRLLFPGKFSQANFPGKERLEPVIVRMAPKTAGGDFTTFNFGFLPPVNI